MITCKLCGTELEKKNMQRDGSLLCPVCGQIYWKVAVDRAKAKAEKLQGPDKTSALHLRRY